MFQPSSEDQVALALQQALGIYTPGTWGIHDQILDFTGNFGDLKVSAQCSWCGPVPRIPCEVCQSGCAATAVWTALDGLAEQAENEEFEDRTGRQWANSMILLEEKEREAAVVTIKQEAQARMDEWEDRGWEREWTEAILEEQRREESEGKTSQA